MKKIMLVLITCVVIITGCSLNNTPNSKVEELLGKYQGLDNSISISSYPITKREDLDDDIENKYRELIKKQYRNLSYEIKSSDDICLSPDPAIQNSLWSKISDPVLPDNGRTPLSRCESSHPPDSLSRTER